MAGRNVESKQHIKDEDGHLPRDKGSPRERWGRYLSTLLDAISVAFDRVVIEDITHQPIPLPHADPLSPTETEGALKAMTDRKATVPGGLPAELLKLGLVRESTKVLYHFHSIIAAVWTSG